MEFKFTGENIEVTNAMENYIKDKLEGISKYFKDENITLKITVRKDKDTIKVKTIIYQGNKLVARAEDKNSDFYRGVTKVKYKLQRQIKTLKNNFKYETKNYFNHKLDESDEITPGINISVKIVCDEGLTADDAALKLESLGYDFLMFRDIDTHTPCVIYKKDHGVADYGVLRMETK